jgi:hypothetical protein
MELFSILSFANPTGSLTLFSCSSLRNADPLESWLLICCYTARAKGGA